MELPQAPAFLWELLQQLRRRRFLLGLDDYHALREALRVGFGWSSRQALCDLCVALWAKTALEAETVRTLFAQIEQQDLPNWDLPRTDAEPSLETPGGRDTRLHEQDGKEKPPVIIEEKPSSLVALQPYRGASAISTNSVP